VAGLTAGLMVGLAARSKAAEDGSPRAGFRWREGLAVGLAVGLRVGLAGGLAGGLVGGLAFGLQVGLEAGLGAGLGVGLASVLAFGLAAGLMVGLMAGYGAGLTPAQPDLAKAVGPGAVLARDRRTFGTLALLFGLPLGLLFGLAFGLRVGLEAGLEVGLEAGLAFGLGVGLAFGLAQSMWWEFLVARCGLAVLRRVPWRFMGFLADAHERRGVLRQAGAVYQFRHVDLQRHLAGRQA
jgi:hypothetical protein